MASRFAVIKFKSLGAAYQMANQVLNGVEVFELSPLGSEAQLLLSSESESFETWLQQKLSEYKNEVLESTLIQNISKVVLKAYLSQVSNKPQPSLAIIESQSLGKIFQLAQRVAETSTDVEKKIIDLRCLRTEGGPSYLMLTQVNLKELGINAAQDLKVTEIPQVSNSLSSFFIS